MTRLRIIAEYDMDDDGASWRRVFNDAVARVIPGIGSHRIPGTLVYLATEECDPLNMGVDGSITEGTVTVGRNRTEFEP